MGKYSDRIITISSDKSNIKYRPYIVITWGLFILLFTSISGSMIYKKFFEPTVFTAEEAIGLIEGSEYIKSSIEEISEDINIMPISYLGNTYVANEEKINKREYKYDIVTLINYSTASATSIADVTFKYKSGWYIDSIDNIKVEKLVPWFGAGESFLNQLSNEIYNKGVFIFDNIKWAFAKSYVDSLRVLTEEGDLDSTRVEISSVNSGGIIDMYATMKFNYETGGWDLVDFETGGTR